MKKIPVTISGMEINIGDKTIPLISGEFHFWRVQKSNWRAILQTAKNMGVSTITTYVAWNFHEIEPGEYDFEGRTSPERDLKGFLELSQEMGIYIIIRPGPYIYAEWAGGGVPKRATELHRLDPRFIEMSRDYIHAVSQVFLPFLATNGGHIVLVQVDNEPFPDLTARAEEIGACGGKGLFSNWLSSQYDNNIDQLNTRWQSNYTTFEEPHIYFEECAVNRSAKLLGRILSQRKHANRYIDGQKFVEFYCSEVIRIGADMYKEAGVDCPLFMNGFHPYYQNFKDVLNYVDLAGLDGLHRHTPLFDPEAAMFEEYEDDFISYLEPFKILLADTGKGYCAEMGSGQTTYRMAGYMRHAPKPEHNIFDYLLYIANGMQGWNWYMLVDRDAWVAGPINQTGDETEFAGSIRDTMKIAENIQPAQMEIIQNCALITYKGHRTSDAGNWPRVWNALLDSDFDFALCEPTYSTMDKEMLFYGGAEWLPEKAYQRLDEYVREGGNLVCFNETPLETDLGTPQNTLGLIEPTGVRPVSLPIHVTCGEQSMDITEGGHCGKIFAGTFSNLPDDATPIILSLSGEAKDSLVDLGLAEGESKEICIGYTRALGKGQVFHLALNPNKESVEFFRNYAGVSPMIKTQSKQVLTYIHRQKNTDKKVAFAINRSAQDLNVVISIDPAAIGLAEAKQLRFTHALTGETQLATVQNGIAETTLPAKAYNGWVGLVEQEN